MNRLWLLIDVDNIASRARHTTGDLENGTLVGVFRAIASLQEFFQTRDVAFCFDGGPSKRADLDSKYKETRKAKRRAYTPEERAAFREYRRQLGALRATYLRQLGYRNIFCETGYEADDLIAVLVKALPAGDEAVVVSSDQDLFQLVRGCVRCYNPITRVQTTLQSFTAKYGIKPAMWSDVKAIAGCKSDDIRGIEGIGEKRAIKFLRHEFAPETKWHDLITQNSTVWQFNLELTRLPFPGCPPLELRDNRPTVARWEALMDELDMPALRPHAPHGSLTPPPKVVSRYAPYRPRGSE